MILKFWGTRGSIPVPGKDTLIFGGNTPCVELRNDNNGITIIDCGSGLRELGNSLDGKDYPDIIDIFLSHYHWDHIQGIPFFKPLYNPKKIVNFFGMSSFGTTLENLLSYQMVPNHFPIKMEEFKAKVTFTEIEPAKIYQSNNFQIETLKVAHPSPTLTFKLTYNDKCIVYMTDNEIILNSKQEVNSDSDFQKANEELISFCRDCDYLIHDAMYEESSMAGKKGWGHSGNISLSKFGVLAGVKNLVLFHYNPDYTDEKINNILNDTKYELSKNSSETNCLAAKEGLEIVL
jgi:phosphoribosyl 1,2-cyclic phosphodiesterase